MEESTKSWCFKPAPPILETTIRASIMKPFQILNHLQSNDLGPPAITMNYTGINGCFVYGLLPNEDNQSLPQTLKLRHRIYSLVNIDYKTGTSHQERKRLDSDIENPEILKNWNFKKATIDTQQTHSGTRNPFSNELYVLRALILVFHYNSALC